VCVCVCVSERERECMRESVCVCVCVREEMYERVYVCLDCHSLSVCEPEGSLTPILFVSVCVRVSE